MFNVKKGDTNIEVQAELIVCTRLINNRLNRIITQVDGTTIDLNKKILRVSGLDNEVFEEFARIQMEALDAN